MLRGRAVADQAGSDTALRELDGTPGLSRLGASVVLDTSLEAALLLSRSASRCTGVSPS